MSNNLLKLRGSRVFLAAVALGLVGVASSLYAIEQIQGPTEFRFWDRAKAFNGYTLFGAFGTTYLIDMEGKVAHMWPGGGNPKLFDNGHVLTSGRDASGLPALIETDWDGKTAWTYVEKRKDYNPHHDHIRVFNKKLNAPTTMFIANKTVTKEAALAAGFDPKNVTDAGGQMDTLVEVDMKGNVVWEWWFFDHGVQDVDPAKANYVGAGKSIADYPRRLNFNLPGRPLRRDWLHCNSMDYNPDLDQVVVSSVQGEIYVIDHGGTFVAGDPQASIAKAKGPAGDFLYRFGDPARYKQGEPPHILDNWDEASSGTRQLGGVHNAHWIEPGLPGAGHLMFFNNGQYLFERTPQSSIIEINPYLDGSGRDTGKYVNPPDAGYTIEKYHPDTHKLPRQISKQVVWAYRSKSNKGFFSQIGGGGQRLPNGNTLICSDTEGHFFEVTPDGTLVWEYINPTTKDGAMKIMPDELPMVNGVFRAYRYAPDYVAFKGHDLTAKSLITDLPKSAIPVMKN
jgi:Arylsulfotransferase (ASST)